MIGIIDCTTIHLQNESNIVDVDSILTCLSLFRALYIRLILSRHRHQLLMYFAVVSQPPEYMHQILIQLMLMISLTFPQIVIKWAQWRNTPSF